MNNYEPDILFSHGFRMSLGTSSLRILLKHNKHLEKQRVDYYFVKLQDIPQEVENQMRERVGNLLLEVGVNYYKDSKLDELLQLLGKRMGSRVTKEIPMIGLRFGDWKAIWEMWKPEAENPEQWKKQLAQNHEEYMKKSIDEETLIFSLDEILGMENYPIMESVTLHEAQVQYINVLKKELDLVEQQNNNWKRRIGLFQRIFLKMAKDAIKFGEAAEHLAQDMNE